MADPAKKGRTYIGWGTEGVLPGYQTAIVDSIKSTDKGDVVEESGNTGRTTGVLLVDDGFDADISCVYESNINWPSKGDTILLKRTRDAVAKSVLVTETNDESSRKATGKINFKVIYRPDLVL